MEYDAKGNVTTDENGWQYSYDAENRVVEIKDADGRPIVNCRCQVPGEWVIETQQYSLDLR